MYPSQQESACRYSEQDIQQVARGLFRSGKQTWSNNPRLYTILRDIDQIGETGQGPLMDTLIKNGFNDLWIPITSESILYQILPQELHFRFLQAQRRVCIQAEDFRIGVEQAHGHFDKKDSPPFECLRSIGSGHSGHVEEVLSTADGQVYARKNIRKASYSIEARRIIERFRCEVQALRRIKHRHCVEIVGSYTNSQYLSIIMSPVADCNLEEFLQHAKISLEPDTAPKIRKWFGCLATAVHYLHTNQIRHRDIKPANILVYDSNILLVDFELALDWKDLAQSTTTAPCGRTALYAAPEVIALKKCNSTSDIWSLGCVFLEMATVIKGKSIAQLRQHFHSQTESNTFFNNPKGILDWISLLENLSTEDNAPLLWISKMLYVDKTHRSRAAEITQHIRGSHTGLNPYFGHCCRPLDLQGRRQYQSLIFRNPEVTSSILPVQALISFLHPQFMINHLTPNSMKEFTGSIVVEDQWEASEAEVQLSCLPFRPLFLNVRRFLPASHLYALQTYPNSKLVTFRYSPPMGIYEPNLETMAESFNSYLDQVVDNGLLEYASFMLELHGNDLSSSALMILFKWFQQGKENLPGLELLIMKSAIKLILVQTILGLSLVLEEIPEEFKHDYFQGYSGPQPYSLHTQSPRLVNRQAKVAFFLLYKSLLERVFNGFKYLISKRKSWTSCLFISMCLAFLLERIEAGSREFLYFSKTAFREDLGGITDIKDYCDEIDSVIFDRLYRLLCTIKGQNSASSMSVELLERLKILRAKFDSEGCQKPRPDIRVQHSSRLVAALLDLVHRN